jgi:Peptidase family M28
MRALETAAGLAEFARRGAGTDAERRAARWLADELATGGREVVVEPFWCRPEWPLAHLWHVGLALAGSLVSVASARAGAAMLLVALLSIVADGLTGISPGRRLTPERASQNVVAIRPAAPRRGAAPVRLIVTANYDAGRAGFAYRPVLRRAASAVRRALFGFTVGWLGWLSLTIVALLALAIVRIGGHKSETIGAIQLLPTIVLVLSVALLLELATAEPGPAAGDNGSGVGVAIELVRALDAAPPRHVAVELVLQGAGDAEGLGLRRYLRSHRAELTPGNTVVIGVAACGSGSPRWWTSDGPLIPLRYNRQLRALCAELQDAEPTLDAASHRGRGAAPAFTAMLFRRPAVSVGCLDPEGLAPRSHRRDDTAATIDPEALDSAVQFGLLLVDEIDRWLAETQRPHAATRA